MQKIQARWYHVGRTKPITKIVLHCTVSGESGTGAEAVARYFARGERKASAHRVSDNNSTIICVDDEDTAFAAAGANSDGIHLELVGMPDQSEAQWLDAFSKAMLFQAGLTIREWSREYGIPLRWLTVQQVADGKTRGLCTHADCSLAFPLVSTGHYDPGPHFPKAEALRIWTPQPDAPPQEDESMFIMKAPPGEVYATRFVDPPVAVTITAGDEKALKAAGVKVLPLAKATATKVMQQIGQALD